MGVLTACWVRAELDDHMRLNNWSIAASYDDTAPGQVGWGQRIRLQYMDFHEMPPARGGTRVHLVFVSQATEGVCYMKRWSRLLFR